MFQFRFNMSEDKAVEVLNKFYNRKFIFIVGIIFIVISENSWMGISFKSLHIGEIGLALLIATIVSKLFDVGYHQEKFIAPVEDIQRKNEVLLEKVGNFDQIVGYSQKNNIKSIFGRREGDNGDIKIWRNKIEEAVSQADSYLFILARSLDTLTHKHSDTGFLSCLERSLNLHKNLKVSIILMSVPILVLPWY